MIARGLLIGLLFLACGQPLVAQVGLVYPDGRAPTVVPPGLVEGKGDILRCLVVWGQTPILARPSADAQVLEHASFLSFHFVAGIDDTQKFLFLVTVATEADYPRLPVRRHHGWIDRRYCLEFAGPAGRGPEGLRDPRSSIHRKAMLVNRLEVTNNVARLLERVPFLNQPHEQGQSLCERSLFSVYYVFAERPEYLLLGTEPRIADAVRDRDQLLGWVPKSRACQWNTREAVEFNKRDVRNELRTEPCRIFLHADELEAYVKVGDDRQVPPIAVEDLGVTQWRYDQARFPLIDSPEGPSVLSFRGNTLYRVGFVGDVFQYSERTGALERLATGRQIEVMRSKVDELQRRLSKVQVCFLIDATFSMDPWIKAAANAVNSIVAGLGSRFAQRQEWEVSVNFYRDASDGPLALRFHPFRRPFEARAILESEQPCGGGEPYELMHAAICRRLQVQDTPDAKERMAFDPDAVKILILIGDDGNDPADAEYTLDRVYTTIRQAGGVSPIGFLAFPVGTSARRQTFVTQAEELTRRLNQAERAAYVAGRKGLDDDLKKKLEMLTSQVGVTGNVDEIVQRVYDRFQFAFLEKEYYQRALEYLYAGREIPDDLAMEVQARVAAETSSGEGAMPDAKPFGVIWQWRMEELIRKNQLEPLQLAGHGVQLFQEGWLAEYDPQETAAPGSRDIPPCIRHAVLMHRSEVSSLFTFLRVVLENWQSQSLQRTWKAGLDTVTGGDVTLNPDMSIHELMRMHFGIKARHGLLALSFDELGRIEPAKMAQLRMTLDECYYRLRDAYEEKEADYAWVPIGGTGRMELKRSDQERERRFWWYGDAREDIRKEARAWIEREMLP